ncbi:hypothetical protein ACKKBG_A13835 [Auxenochlorella protothecoides x Auxenochlorella symbiontica]
MVCPMRVVLAAVSALLAGSIFLVAFSRTSERRKARESQEEDEEDRHWSMHVLDMFTGRYLLQQCRTALRGTSSAATRLHR